MNNVIFPNWNPNGNWRYPSCTGSRTLAAYTHGSGAVECGRCGRGFRPEFGLLPEHNRPVYDPQH